MNLGVRVTDDQTLTGKRGPVLAWALWDWGSSAFNTIVYTFVFTVYLTSGAFGDVAPVSEQLGWALAISGFIIAILAPITGQRSDATGRRKLWFVVNTYIVVAATALMFFVQPHPSFLLLGLFLLAAGNIFFEFASVNYNAMLLQLSTPQSVGRISGFGWGMGYLGGIVLLLIIHFAFVEPGITAFGLTDQPSSAVRISMLLAAAWFGVFALPVLLVVPEYRPPSVIRPRVNLVRSYCRLFKDLVTLWHSSRQTLIFLVASAIFRDGLNGIFIFGGVLGVGSFGLSAGEVMLFAIAANILAGLTTISVGLLDDRLGPKPVIISALVGLIIFGVGLFIFHDGGATAFWTFGLGLSLFVGPAQSASRSFLARITPSERAGEIFGLYAMTGRVGSFLAPLAFTLFVVFGGAQYWGVLGIALVLLIGVVFLLPVASGPTNPRRNDYPPS